MSNKWWDSRSSKTTVGHGIYSQHKPEMHKEWVHKEERRRERSTSPKRSFSPDNSLHRSSLFYPIQGEHIEHRHHAMTKDLSELRAYQTLPPAPGHLVKTTTELSSTGHQPLKSQYLPHLAHHHHFGWNLPTPEARVAVFNSRDNFYKMGAAQNYNHAIHAKAHLITSRKA